MIGLCLLMAFGGFVGLSLGMSRHQRDVLGRSLSPSASLRWKAAGWIVLVLSFLLAVFRDGAALGAVYWLGELTLAALGVASCITALTPKRR